jgi:serine/threonine protein kinase
MLRHYNNHSRKYIRVTCDSPSGAFGCMIENSNALFNKINNNPEEFLISNGLTIDDLNKISACKLFFSTSAYHEEITKLEQILNTRSFTFEELNLESVKGKYTCTITSKGFPFEINGNTTYYLHLIFINKCNSDLLEVEDVSINFDKFVTDIVPFISKLHDNDIIHRDIKPENILNCSSSYKLIDFGLICRVDDDKCIQYLAGTPLYIAPYITKHYNERENSYKPSNLLAILNELNKPINSYRIIEFLKRNDWFALGLTITKLFELNKFNISMTEQIKEGILYLCDIRNNYSGYTTENIVDKFKQETRLQRSYRRLTQQPRTIKPQLLIPSRLPRIDSSINVSSQIRDTPVAKKTLTPLELLIEKKTNIEQAIEKEQNETKQNNLKRILMNINMDIAVARLTHLKKK